MNLDILIRIRDQLTGLSRAQQGLRDLNTTVAKSSAQWSNMAASTLGVMAAVGLLGAEIRHVVGNIEQIPGVPAETVASIQLAKENFKETRQVLDQWIAKGAQWFTELGQGLGYLAGAAVYGWDSASEAYTAADRAAQASIASAAAAKREQEALAAAAKETEAAARSQQNFLDASRAADAAWTDYLQIGESDGARSDRLRKEGNALLAQAKTTKDQEASQKIQEDAFKRLGEAKRIDIALTERSAQLGASQAEYARSLLPPKEQLVQVEMELLELKTRQAEIDKSTQAGFAQSVVLEERLFELAKERDQLKEQAKERDPDKSKDSAEMGQMDQLDRNDAVGQMTQSLEMLPTLAETAGEAIQTVYGGFTNSIYGALQGLWNRTMTLGDALRSVAAGFASSMLQAIAQIAAQWVARQILMATVGKAIAAASVAALIPMAMAQSAIWAAPATLATIASFGAAAAQAPASMAAALAAGQGLAAIPGFADGGGVDGPGGPRSDSILARLSDGEYVIPAATVDRFGRGYFDALLAGVIPAGRTDRAAGMQAYMAPAAMAGAGEGGSSAGGVPSVAFASFNNQQHAEQWLETQGGERYMVNFLKRRGFKHT